MRIRKKTNKKKVRIFAGCREELSGRKGKKIGRSRF
jgi:hypothetical protein